MFKILGAKNRRKNLHKHPGPPFQIKGGPISFSPIWTLSEKILFDNWKRILTNFQHRNHPSVGKILYAFVCKYFELEHLPFRERP